MYIYNSRISGDILGPVDSPSFLWPGLEKQGYSSVIENNRKTMEKPWENHRKMEVYPDTNCYGSIPIFQQS